MRIGCPILLDQQICKRSSTPGIWQQRDTAAARGTSDAFHPAANLKPGNSPFFTAQGMMQPSEEFTACWSENSGVYGLPFFFYPLLSLSLLSHLLSLQDQVAMEPLSIPVVLLTLSSFLISQWIFHVACPWLSERLIPAFLTLTHMQRTEWSSRSNFFLFFFQYVYFVHFL